MGDVVVFLWDSIIYVQSSRVFIYVHNNTNKETGSKARSDFSIVFLPEDRFVPKLVAKYFSCVLILLNILLCLRGSYVQKRLSN